MNIPVNEFENIAENIKPKFEEYLNKYDKNKYPHKDYETYKNSYSNLSVSNDDIYGSLVWKWGHVGKKNFMQSHKNLIKRVEKFWPQFVESKESETPENTFNWWKVKLPKTSYITVAYITHLTHHKERIPIIDQHNFRAMNELIKEVRASHTAKKKPSNWNDIKNLENFMTEVLNLLENRNPDQLDKFLMMYGKEKKPRKQKCKKKN